MADQLSRKKILNEADQKVNEYLAVFGNCAQIFLLALQEQFGLDDGGP